MKDTIHKLSPISVILHWVIGLALIATLAMGLYIHNFASGAEKFQLLGLHKSFGILILWVAALRILWRFYNGMPKPLAVPPRWQKILGHIVHGVLLIATVAMPMSGIIMTLSAGFPLQLFGLELVSAGDKSPILRNIAHTMHGIGGKVVIGFIVIHILAAVKHHYIDKNNIVRRMLGRRV